MIAEAEIRANLDALHTGQVRQQESITNINARLSKAIARIKVLEVFCEQYKLKEDNHYANTHI